MLADLFTIVVKSVVSYKFSDKSTPNLSLNGAESIPALVVAPIRVNFSRSILID